MDRVTILRLCSKRLWSHILGVNDDCSLKNRERRADRDTRRETKWWTRYWRGTKRQDGVKNEQKNEEAMKMASLGMPGLSIRHQDCLDPPKSILKIDLCGDGKRKRQSRGWVEGRWRESRSNRRKKINYESVHISVEDYWEQTNRNGNGERRERQFERRTEGE